MKIQPRPYQLEAANAALAEFNSGVNSTGISMPTGTGKTVVFSMVGDAKDWGRVLVLAGRQELIDQAQKKIFDVTGERADIDMGQSYAAMLEQDLFTSGKFVCGSIQTVSKSRRLSRYDFRDFGLIIVDEGHHGTARTYRRVVDAARERNPDIKVLYVSATFKRADGQAMGKVCDTIAYNYDINEAISDGWLVPVKQKFAHVSGLDFSHIHTKGGDLDEQELAAVLSDDGGEMPHKIALAMVEASGTDKTVVFTVNVKCAYRVAEIIGRIRGKPDLAVAMDGTWDKDRRRAVLEAYERDEFQYLVNCNLLVEGWDSPSVKVVGMARPTKSRSLYAQMVGRGLRPLAGLVDDPSLFSCDSRRGAILASEKPDLLVVDLAGNSGRHKLVCTADLLGGNYSSEVVEAAKKRAKNRKTPADMKKLLDEEYAKVIRKSEQAEQRRSSEKGGIYARANIDFQDVDPFAPDVHTNVMSGMGNDFVKEELASAKQIEYLRSMGVDARGMPKDVARRLCNESFARKAKGLTPLPKARILESHGFPATEMTKERADAVLDLLKANSWERPVAPIQRSQMSLHKQDGLYGLVVKTGGKTLDVGPLHPSVDDAKAYARLIEGT